MKTETDLPDDIKSPTDYGSNVDLNLNQLILPENLQEVRQKGSNSIMMQSGRM
jgi:hypothetical protein